MCGHRYATNYEVVDADEGSETSFDFVTIRLAGHMVGNDRLCLHPTKSLSAGACIPPQGGLFHVQSLAREGKDLDSTANK